MYLKILCNYSYVSCINTFTRVTDNSKSCIVHIFVKYLSPQGSTSEVLETNKRDQFCTGIMIPNTLPKKEKRQL